MIVYVRYKVALQLFLQKKDPRDHLEKQQTEVILQIHLPWLFNYFTPPAVPPVQQNFFAYEFYYTRTRVQQSALRLRGGKVIEQPR